MTQPIAYEFEGITMCPVCALRASNLGLMLMKVSPLPESMDEVIATMALMQVENGMPICTPVPTTTPATSRCEGRCAKEFRVVEAGDAA